MINRLAIIIVGKQDAGKTTTLRHFCNTYDDKTVSTFKQGLRNNFRPFTKENPIKVDAYFLPASRTERATKLADTFNDLGWCPPFMFIAEQLNGAEYNNTIRTLIENKYHIKEFTLYNDNRDSVWHYYSQQDEALIQFHRTEQIADYVRAFIKSRM